MTDFKIPTEVVKYRERLQTESVRLKELSQIQLSVDPGSTKMGVSFFDMDSQFLCSHTLRVKENLVAARRLFLIREQFNTYLQERFAPDVRIMNTTLELLPPSQITPSLPISPGCVISHPQNFSRLPPRSAVPVNTWKSVAKQLGCTMHDPKGIRIFHQIPWKYTEPATEDEADSIIIHLAYCWEVRGYCWLGPNLRVRRMKR